MGEVLHDREGLKGQLRNHLPVKPTTTTLVFIFPFVVVGKGGEERRWEGRGEDGTGGERGEGIGDRGKGIGDRGG